MKIEISSVPNAGSYLLTSIPMKDIASFDSVLSCPACGVNENWRVLARIGGSAESEALSLRACRSCGHVTYDRLPSDAWLARYYDGEWDQARRTQKAENVRLRAENTSPWAMAKHIADLHIPNDAKILDFGCGFGDGLFALQHRGYKHLYGVEPGRHRVDVASRYFPGNILHGSIDAAQELARREGPFDLIAMNHVAEHLRAPEDVVGALAKLLSPRGILVISVPHPRSESPIHLPLYLAHLHHFSPVSLTKLLTRCGFQARRWVASDIQLAVAGSRVPFEASNYQAQPPEVSTEFVDSLASFVSAPWQSKPSNEASLLNYFHPWSDPEGLPGFRVMSGLARRWYGDAMSRVLPAIVRAEQSGIDRHNVLRRVVIRTSRLLLGRDAATGGNLLRYRVLHADCEVPWIVDRSAGLPVLGK